MESETEELTSENKTEPVISIVDEVNNQVGNSSLYPEDILGIVNFMVKAQEEEKEEIEQTSSKDEQNIISKVSSNFVANEDSLFQSTFLV